MMPQVYLAIGTVILLLTVGRVVWRKGTKSIDWDLIVAFVRLDFDENPWPPTCIHDEAFYVGNLHSYYPPGKNFLADEDII